MTLKQYQEIEKEKQKINDSINKIQIAIDGNGIDFYEMDLIDLFRSKSYELGKLEGISIIENILEVK